LIHYHVGCGLCREMMWLQNRDSKFRAKSLCSRLYGIRLGCPLSTDFQMIPKWIATILWQIYLFPSNKWFFLAKGHRMKNDWWFLSTIALFTQVGVQQIGSKNMAFTACQTNSIHLIWLLVTCTCFLPSKKDSNGFTWLTRSIFWVPANDFPTLDQQEFNAVFQAWVHRVDEVSEGNRDYVGWKTSFIHKSFAHLYQTGLGHVLIDQTTCKYIPQPRPLGSEIRLLGFRISRVWILPKVK
jgi:hypothetical protein